MLGGSRLTKSVNATVAGSNKINVRYCSPRLFLARNSNRFRFPFPVNGKAHSFTLPSTLARGGYLIRHEIIALHLANQPGGAEFYPGCIQINVGGNQSGAPSPNELVRFPGAYKDNDPGILVNAFSNAAYKFPGPVVSKLASKSSGSNGGDSNDNPDSPSSSPTPSKGPKTETPQPSPSVAPPKDGGSGGCKPKKKRAVYDDSDDSIPPPPVPAPAPETPLDDFKPPRHFSRVMGRLVRYKSHSH